DGQEIDAGAHVHGHGAADAAQGAARAPDVDDVVAAAGAQGHGGVGRGALHVDRVAGVVRDQQDAFERGVSDHGQTRVGADDTGGGDGVGVAARRGLVVDDQGLGAGGPDHVHGG